MKLNKYNNNPVLSPNSKNEWEALVSTNPGAWYDADKKQVMMLYRAAGNDDTHRIHLGLAVSKNGFDFERASDQPVFTAKEDTWEGGSIEDPRIIKFGEYYFITYSAVPVAPGRYWENNGNCRNLPGGLPGEAPVCLRENLTRTGLAITKDFKKYYRPGYLTSPLVDDRDVVIFPEKINGKFVTLHRPMQWTGERYGCESPAIWIAFSDDLLEEKKLSMLAKSKFDWEVKIGGAAPPIKTKYGWLTLYHAVGPDSKYRVGAMLLDSDDPRKVLHRSTEAIMEPECAFENEGIYKGFCFPCGNVVINDTFFVYYGGADQHVGVATCKLDDLIDYLLGCPGDI